MFVPEEYHTKLSAGPAWFTPRHFNVIVDRSRFSSQMFLQLGASAMRTHTGGMSEKDLGDFGEFDSPVVATNEATQQLAE